MNTSSTAYEALKVLELAGVLTWAHRVARIQVCERDLFGRLGNPLARHPHQQAYVFRDPASKSENPAETQNQEIQSLTTAPADPDSPLERALRQLSAGIKGRLLMNKDGGMLPAT